jgi:hypothetical protein
MELTVSIVLSKGDFRIIKNIPEKYLTLPDGQVPDDFISWVLHNVPEFHGITEKEFKSRCRYGTLRLNTKFGKLSSTYLTGPGFEFVWTW